MSHAIDPTKEETNSTGYGTNWASLVAQVVKESTCNAGDLDSISGLERSPGGGLPRGAMESQRVGDD